MNEVNGTDEVTGEPKTVSLVFQCVLCPLFCSVNLFDRSVSSEFLRVMLLKLSLSEEESS